MSKPSMSIDEALALLRELPGHPDVEGDDADALREAVVVLATRASREVVTGVGEALLFRGLDCLDWNAVEGARLIRALLDLCDPSRFLVESSLGYLSLYFQELDDTISSCWGALQLGGEPASVSRSLARAVNSLEGV